MVLVSKYVMITIFSSIKVLILILKNIRIKLLSFNYLNDMDILDAIIIPMGCSSYTTNDKYYIKYIKYKNKYLKLKK